VTDLEYKLIIRFLIGRLIGVIVTGVLVAGILVFLVDNLQSDANSALLTFMGTTLAFLGGGFVVLSNALGRDILEFIERLKAQQKD